MDEFTWARAEAYDRYIGRWSREVAPLFLRWLHLPAGRDWLDVGCGTGALISAILAVATPARVRGYDLSPQYVAATRARLNDPRVEVEQAEATALPDPPHSYDTAVSGLVLNFVPDAARMLAEMRRVVRRHSTVAVYVWDYAERMQLLRVFWDAAIELDPAAVELDEGRRFKLCRPEALRELFEAAGLGRVEVRGLEVPTRFRDFADYWEPFLGGQGPAPGYIAALDEAQRAALRERIRSRLRREADGRIALRARAWAVRGTA